MYGGRIGWVLSVGLHIGVAGFAMFGLPELSRPQPTPPPVVNIEFVRIDERTQVVAPIPEIEPEPVDTEQSNFAAEEAANDAPPEAVPLPAQTQVQAPPKAKPKPKPKPRVLTNLRNRISPNTKPKPPSRLKVKRIAALIDRSIKEEQQVPKQAALEKNISDIKPAESQPDMFAGLRGRVATASLIDALSQKLSGCWNFPGGAKGIENMSVTVRIFLRPDGSLSRVPEFVRPGNMDDGFYRTFAESARRAVRLCAPFEEAVDYVKSGQTYIDFNFNGAEFAGY